GAHTAARRGPRPPRGAARPARQGGGAGARAGGGGARAGRAAARAGRAAPPPANPPVPLLEPRDGPPTLVTSVPGLDRTVAALAAGKGPVAVDAERASGFRYGHRAFLVQWRRGGAGTALMGAMARPNMSGLD